MIEDDVEIDKNKLVFVDMSRTSELDNRIILDPVSLTVEVLERDSE